MKNELKDLTKGCLWRQVLLFSLPLMLSNVLQVLFNMSDIAVVGRFSGEHALGSVGSTATLVTLFTGLLIGLGSGVNVLTARYYGAGNRKALRETMHSGLLICLLAGMVLMGAGMLLARQLLQLLNTKEELLEGAVLYLKIYFVGLPALAVYNFGNGVLSAVGDTRHPLYFLGAAGILNVGLNLFFVIVCRMSVDGVALASIISQYASAAAIVLFLFRSKEVYGMRVRELAFHRKRALDVLVLGVPAGLQNAIFCVANLFIQAGVNTFDAVVVEGNSAAANADGLVYDVMAAFYMACSSFMGQNFGAGIKERVRKSYFICIAYSVGIGLVMGGLLVLFGRPFLSLFTKSEPVLAAGMERLKIMGLSYGFSGVMDCTIAACRGLGKTMVPTIIVILGSCGFRVLWVYTIFAYFGTLTSLYLLYIFSWGITGLAEVLYFIPCYRKQMSQMTSS